MGVRLPGKGIVPKTKTTPSGGTDPPKCRLSLCRIASPPWSLLGVFLVLCQRTLHEDSSHPLCKLERHLRESVYLLKSEGTFTLVDTLRERNSESPVVQEEGDTKSREPSVYGTTQL